MKFDNDTRPLVAKRASMIFDLAVEFAREYGVDIDLVFLDPRMEVDGKPKPQVTVNIDRLVEGRLMATKAPKG